MTKGFKSQGSALLEGTVPATQHLTTLTVDPGESVGTGAVVFIRSRVAAGSFIQTWLPCPTRVQIWTKTTQRR